MDWWQKDVVERNNHSVIPATVSAGVTNVICESLLFTFLFAFGVYAHKWWNCPSCPVSLVQQSVTEQFCVACQTCKQQDANHSKYKDKDTGFLLL